MRPNLFDVGTSIIINKILEEGDYKFKRCYYKSIISIGNMKFIIRYDIPEVDAIFYEIIIGNTILIRKKYSGYDYSFENIEDNVMEAHRHILMEYNKMNQQKIRNLIRYD